MGKYKANFSPHFAMIFIQPAEGYFLVGSNGNKALSNVYYDGKTVHVKAPMPTEKTFFAHVFHKGKIWTFGGYDSYEKTQLNTCEYYDLALDRWFNSPALSQKGQVEYRLIKERSQASACVFEDDVGFIFAGYHRDEGTLNSIERFDFKRKMIEKMDLVVPAPIRRFAAIKISTTKILLIGGLTKTS